MRKISRQTYMNKEISFEEYYRHIAKLAGIAFNPEDPFIARVKNVLEAGDNHLNRISLHIWDMKAICASNAIKKACKEVEGEFWSLSIGVCVMKQAARDAVNRRKDERILPN